PPEFGGTAAEERRSRQTTRPNRLCPGRCGPAVAGELWPPQPEKNSVTIPAASRRQAGSVRSILLATTPVPTGCGTGNHKKAIAGAITHAVIINAVYPPEPVVSAQ